MIERIEVSIAHVPTRTEYALLVSLVAYGPLTGGELAETYPISSWGWSAMVTGGKLARLAKRTGFIEKHEGIWHLRNWLEVCA